MFWITFLYQMSFVNVFPSVWLVFFFFLLRLSLQSRFLKFYFNEVKFTQDHLGFLLGYLLEALFLNFILISVLYFDLMYVKCLRSVVRFIFVCMWTIFSPLYYRCSWSDFYCVLCA